MINLTEAWLLLDRSVSVLGSRDIAISQCPGWVTDEEVRAPIDVAPFRNSAMDGFAVATECLDTLPISLEIGATVFAGGATDATGDVNKAVKVMTGAVVPDNYDAVIPVEDVTYNDHTVTITLPVKPGQHVRLPGEDVAKGERILNEGELIRTFAVGVLASLGMEVVKVVNKPRVLIISTGDELVQPGESLKQGQLHDSNGPTVQAMIGPFCLSIDRRPKTADNLDMLTTALQTDHDVIITTGGVSAGERDFVPQAAARAGWQKVFHKVAIKPGKPVFFAAKNNQLLLGLPGNPLSTAVTCALFAIPALKKMMGRSDFFPQLLQAELEGEPLKSNRQVIWPGKIRSQSGRYFANIGSKRSSAALSAALDSDGLVFQNQNEAHQLLRVQVWKWSQILT